MRVQNGLKKAILGFCLAAVPFAVRSDISDWTLHTVKSGVWSDPTVWQSSGTPVNRVPTASDIVLIQLNHTVIVNITTATANILDIGWVPGGFGVGTLSFSTATNATLTMTGTIYVNAGGALNMGTAVNPMPAGVKASLILASPDIDDHGLYLEGLSTFRAHGAPKVPVALGPGTIPAGVNNFTVSGSQVAGWQVGDVITFAGRDDQNTGANQTEERTVSSLTPSGGNVIVGWSPALLHTHAGSAGVRVANITRNVLVRSAGSDLPTDTSFFRHTGSGEPAMFLTLAEFSYLGVGWDYARLGVAVADGTVISSCSFHHSGSGMVNGSSVRVSNSVFYANARAGAYYTFYHSGSPWTGVDFLNNDFIANGTAVGNDQDVLDMRFIGNHVYSNGGDGLFVGGNGSLVASNRIHNNGWGPQLDCGIEANDSKILISSNIISYNDDIGICLDGDGVVVDNTISGNGYFGYGAGDGSIAVSNSVYQNVDVGMAVGGRALVVGGHVYLNGANGVWSNGNSRYSLYGTFLGFDASGASQPNAGAELWMYQNSVFNQPRLYGCRVNPVGGIDYDANETGVLAYNTNFATGTAVVRGDVVLESGTAVTLDHAQPSWRSTATTPVLIRGTGHAASVRSTSDGGAVSQLIAVRFDGSAWRVEGSESGLMHGPFLGSLANQSIAGQFLLDFTPDAFAAAREDDQIVFALIASSKDENVQKKLLFRNNAWNDGGSGFVVMPGATFTLRGVSGTLGIMEKDAGVAYPYHFISSGAVTLEYAGVRQSSAGGLWLSGSGGVSITSTTFNDLGEPGGAYITASSLASTAVLRGLAFDPAPADPLAPLSVRVLGNDVSLSWVLEGFSGVRSGDASDADPNGRLYWAGSTPMGTPSALSASLSGDGLALSWTPPARPPSFYLGPYRLYASSSSAAGPFAQVAAPAAGALSHDHLGLLPETTYYYRLEATDLSGTVSAPPATASAMTGNFSLPALTPSVGARTVGVPWGQAMTLAFNKAMNAGAVAGAVALRRIKDHRGNLLSPPEVVGMSVGPNPANTVFTVTPSAPLPGNSLFELVVTTGAVDLLGQPIPASSTLRFTTLMDRSVHNRVTEGTLAAVVDVPAGALGADGFLVGSSPPSGTSAATRKLIDNTGDALRSPVDGGMEDLKMFDAAGAPLAFKSPVTVTLPYPDADDDGIVDGTEPPVKAKTLAVYWLDRSKAVWHRLPSSRVDTSSRTVSAETAHFTTFAGIGQADTDLSGAHAFPNPFLGGTPETVTFTGLGQISTIRLYTTSGRLVREIHPPVGAGVVDWDLKNQDGEPVASGLYLYRITSGDSTLTGKLGVVR